MRSLTPPPYPTPAVPAPAAPASAPAAPPRRRPGLRMLRAMLTVVVLALAAAASARASTVLDIRGGGNGHGIGMSQYGAQGYARHGADASTILAHYYTGTALGTTDPHRVVRVLLATHGAAFAGATAATGATGHVALDPGLTYRVAVDRTGQLVLRTGAGRLKTTFTAPLQVSGPAPLQVAGRGAYRGSLQYAPNGRGGVQTVDSVALDDYVRGVVAAEMPASWSPAALQAQAIAARTYVITTTVHGNGYDLYDDTRSQMYGGVGAETAATDAAVAATAGEIVTYGGRPAVTYFFSSSGGHTESIQNVWDGVSADPWLQGVSDPYDGAAGDPYHSFSEQLSFAAAQARLGGLVRGRLVRIQVLSRGVSGRIITARIIGTRGVVTAGGAQLAAALGLSSTLATFTAITAQPSPFGLRGAVAPAPAHGHIIVQSAAGGSWHTVAAAALRRNGTFSVNVLGSGRYRVALGALPGPALELGPGPALVSAALRTLHR